HKYYHSHDVYLNTTSYESFGVAVVEAALCGIPIVTSNVGEIPLLWDNETHVLFAEELSGEAFATHVIQLVENPDLANKLTMNAVLKAKSFEWANVKPKWE